MVLVGFSYEHSTGLARKHESCVYCGLNQVDRMIWMGVGMVTIRHIKSRAIFDTNTRGEIISFYRIDNVFEMGKYLILISFASRSGVIDGGVGLLKTLIGFERDEFNDFIKVIMKNPRIFQERFIELVGNLYYHNPTKNVGFDHDNYQQFLINKFGVHPNVAFYFSIREIRNEEDD